MNENATGAEANEGDGQQKLNFEQSLQQLERIVNEIEQGEVSLEESIAKYARGIELVKNCRKILDSAEQKIQLLTRGEGGQLENAGQLDTPEEAQ